jgi:hypothetical protein
LNRDATQLLTGKPGPGGGIAADPWVVALLTVASLVDAPRSEVARKTFDVEGRPVSEIDLHLTKPTGLVRGRDHRVAERG